MSVLGKKRIILWINPAIIHVELWKIFCTLISSSGKTSVDLRSNWNNQHVKSCTWRKETRENRSYSTNSLSVFFTNERWLFSVTYCWRLWLSCFHACEKGRNHSTKAIHGSLHLYALAGKRAGAPWGDPKLKGTGWCCTGFVVITTVVKTEWGHWFYM